VEPEDHAAADVGPGVFDGRTETRKVNQWSVLSVVGVGVVHPRLRDVVEPLPVAGHGLGDVDNLEDFGTAEAGDLHGSHDGEVMACPAPAVTGGPLLQGRWQVCREVGGCRPPTVQCDASTRVQELPSCGMAR
jgi:hypothetical protein